jgi:cytochrome c biogenesis factor
VLPEIGQYALILALLLSVAQAFFGLAGPWRGNQRWMRAVAAVAAVAGRRMTTMMISRRRERGCHWCRSSR